MSIQKVIGYSVNLAQFLDVKMCHRLDRNNLDCFPQGNISKEYTIALPGLNPAKE